MWRILVVMADQSSGPINVPRLHCAVRWIRICRIVRLHLEYILIKVWYYTVYTRKIHGAE